MARIKLKTPWFTPRGSLLARGEHTVSDDWKLPEGAEVLEEAETEEKPEEAPKKAAASKPAAKPAATK